MSRAAPRSPARLTSIAFMAPTATRTRSARTSTSSPRRWRRAILCGRLDASTAVWPSCEPRDAERGLGGTTGLAVDASLDARLRGSRASSRRCAHARRRSPSPRRCSNRRTRASRSARWSGCAITAPRARSPAWSRSTTALTAPSKGGPASAQAARTWGWAPRARWGAALASQLLEYRPRDIAPLTRPPLPGEGVVGAHAPQRRSRPAAAREHVPQRTAGIPAARRRGCVDRHLAHRPSASTRVASSPRWKCPSAGRWRCRRAMRGRLLATFNSGFKLADSNGGFALNGRTYAPLRDGQATFVRYADGRYDVVSWHGGPDAGPERRLRAPEPAADRRGRAPQPDCSTTAPNGARRWATRSGCGARGSASTATAI